MFAFYLNRIVVDIVAFIRELLLTHECVVIPGFGGFISNYLPARIDREDNTFYPPRKQILFNRKLYYNDGLLIGKISESLNVNYGEARNVVDHFVASIKKKLEHREKVTFDKVGVFYNDEKENLHFEPFTDFDFLLESFGLDAFRFEKYDVRKRNIEDVQPAHNVSVKNMLWRAAVILPFVALSVAIPFKTDIFKSKAESATLNPIAAIEMEMNKADNGKQNPVVDEVLLSSQNTVEEQVAQPECTYGIIIGSFKSRENAETQIQKLKNEGYSPDITVTDNGFFRVNAVRNTDLTVIEAQKEILLKTYPNVWVAKY